MPEEPTLEDLQAQILELQNQTKELTEKLSTSNEMNDALKEQLAKARKINTEMFLKLPATETVDKVEEVEDSFEKLVTDTIQKILEGRKK